MTVSNTSTQNSILIISQDVDMTRVWKNLFEQKNCRVISETTARDGVHAEGSP